MTNFIRNFVRDESGAAASEYILLLGLLGGGVAVGAYAFGTKISAAFDAKGNALSACSSSPSATCWTSAS
jgi:pilus assembly protein Flp/PilA